MKRTLEVDDEWRQFMTTNDDSSDEEEVLGKSTSTDISIPMPHPTPIYISTKSKIAYLNQNINLIPAFWGVQVIPYSTRADGIIKKQMKFNSLNMEELNLIKDRLVGEPYYEEHIITSIDNPNGRIKFKDIRKVSIGLSIKDIMSYRCKRKSAFYNCFVMIVRVRIKSVFKEFHVKVFNTGKLEIPGIQTDESLEIVLTHVIATLTPFCEPGLAYNQKSETILINSNFNCGFYIDRELLYDILKIKYNIQCIYDPCSYPGIQCKFYYNPHIVVQSGSHVSHSEKDKYPNVIAVSFMIFRTGSILIVGRCDENVLHIIYSFLTSMLGAEFYSINQRVILPADMLPKQKKTKIRRKNIMVPFVADK